MSFRTHVYVNTPDEGYERLKGEEATLRFLLLNGRKDLVLEVWKTEKIGWVDPPMRPPAPWEVEREAGFTCWCRGRNVEPGPFL